MWWNKVYINRRDWLVDQFEHLDLNLEELVCLLMIDSLNQNHTAITPPILQKKLKLEGSKLDEILHRLMNKKVLLIETSKQSIQFNIDAIFTQQNPFEDIKHSLVSTFEKEFGRPLSSVEMMKLNDLSHQFEDSLIIYGLREAIINQKLSMNYVEKVVKSNHDTR